MFEEHKLSTLQIQELEILKEFQKICEDNNLMYYMVAGSMLGAVRHSGFIPWDDDIDVAMPRKDYDKFLEIAPNLLPSNYYLETPREKKHVTVLLLPLYQKKVMLPIFKKVARFDKQRQDGWEI